MTRLTPRPRPLGSCFENEALTAQMRAERLRDGRAVKPGKRAKKGAPVTMSRMPPPGRWREDPWPEKYGDELRRPAAPGEIRLIGPDLRRWNAALRVWEFVRRVKAYDIATRKRLK